MLPVQKKVPLPKAMRPATTSRRKYPFDEMDVGDMFFVPHKEKNTLATHASAVGVTLGRKFRTRLTYMKETREGWVPCAADDKKAVIGVGVWRTS